MATMIDRWRQARRWMARTFLRPASVTFVSRPAGARPGDRTTRAG